ncbi:HAD family hydrolase [Xanthomonas oryzae]|uniref:HAD family phosphatase n=1 Tax=Xanthomonas oryzae pv. leersiae TaxID=3112258 RepID=A0AAJ6KLA6_9XANT|nr:HAD family phosphatase [Xanthomonas oryzae]WIX06223.1 HAD family phosphatase [Xanthomonas oryzae pv. oryzae]QBG87029.1 HAD family phosphatase [Xanthomonas oryzae]QBG90844.1 HAD family phosphatase [Xanthomonas oryzae]QBG94790.1 HAD family phosphatase [Xanthomonas oryzae]QBH01154.1 HAD family phosphatase [Xanthomonas oryzae]
MTQIAALPFRPQAVIFDMDGLMLDSERAITACLAQAADEQGLQIEPAFWLRMVGTGDVACRLLLGERIGDAAAEAMLAHAQRLYAAAVERGIPHRPGIIALLEYLAAQGMPRAVATSTQRPLALRKLEAADLLWRFDAVCTASDVVHPKPAPDIYLLAARTLAVDPALCLVLEDSPTGVRAALAAGMTPIQIPDLLEPDAAVRALGHRILPSLGDAQRLLEACLSG